MAGNGPPPNPHARRRNARVAMTQLPAEGRREPAPPWPLLPGRLPPRLAEWADVIAAHELELWEKVWATPQAVAWERLRWPQEIGLYVRWLARAEFGDLEAGKEARLLGDRLGLNPLALLRLRWEIVTDEMAERRADRETRSSTSAGGARSARRRGIKAVDGVG